MRPLLLFAKVAVNGELLLMIFLSKRSLEIWIDFKEPSHATNGDLWKLSGGQGPRVRGRTLAASGEGSGKRSVVQPGS